jgi:16S rRNA C967 or C1407 C5-methylase (RsmB/RsmF family)
VGKPKKKKKKKNPFLKKKKNNMSRRRRAYVKEEGTEDQHQHKDGERGNWLSTNFSNEHFDNFYKGNVVSESEWDTFIAAARAPLNTSIRVSPTSFQTTEKRDRFIQLLLRELEKVTSEHQQQAEITADQQQQKKIVRHLNFIPLAIDFTVPRGALKRSQGFKASKYALNSLTDYGFISRQEVVSMVPPCLLDVRPGMKCLDMCAAPGSKTMQMLEKLIDDDGSSDVTKRGGFVVANDVNAGRLDVLQRQIGRNPDATAHMVVTNFDSRVFPTPLMKNPDYQEQQHQQQQTTEDGGNITTTTTAEKQQQFIPFRFDRILADVPCSADGNMRKAADLWDRWSPQSSLALHSQQRGILFRGMQLLKHGGVIVYSTCSMHPVEDEAVVCAAIRNAKEAGGHFELINPREQLPNLKFYPGRRDWKIMSPDRTWVESEEDFLKDFEQGKQQGLPLPLNKNKNNNDDDAATVLYKRKYANILIPSMFPSYAAKNIELVPNIEYCCRVLPHQQDTGGFFIAALRCVKEIPSNTSGNKFANRVNNNASDNNNLLLNHNNSKSRLLLENTTILPSARFQNVSKRKSLLLFISLQLLPSPSSLAQTITIIPTAVLVVRHLSENQRFITLLLMFQRLSKLLVTAAMARI